jgi:DNA polymerase (family 10)
MLDKVAVARALREIGTLLEVKGENPFKVRAYEAGARALEGLQDDLAARVAARRLEELPGVGEALAQKISDLHLTGTTPLLARLRSELPPGILELTRVPELGPRKVAALHAALGVSSLAELEAACRAGRVRELKGFGEKTEARILENLARLGAAGQRVLLSEALDLADQLARHLAGGPVERVEVAGSARRMKETVGDLDLVASSREPAAAAARLLAFPGVAEVLGSGGTKTSVRLASGLQVDLRVVAPEDHATTLHHLTGSKAHHVKLRGLARERGLSLSEYGLSRLEGGPPLAVASEEALYAALGLPFIPPELREDEGELEAARSGTLPDDLVRTEDVRGMVHCHTVWSDGRNTVEEMARAAEALGMEYLTITDHSSAAHYAHGLDAERLRRQWDEIDEVQERVRVKLLKGTESDITEEGGLDFPDEVLERLDVIVASIHTRFRMDEEAMTRRLVRAMSLPVFKIWGHALGRLLLEREPFPCRMEEVLDALAGGRGAVEVNGDPHRLELEPRFLRLARARGIPVVLSVDAHSAGALGHLRFAAGTARRGGVRRGEVLNCRSADDFARAVAPSAGARA